MYRIMPCADYPDTNMQTNPSEHLVLVHSFASLVLLYFYILILPSQHQPRARFDNFISIFSIQPQINLCHHIVCLRFVSERTRARQRAMWEKESLFAQWRNAFGDVQTTITRTILYTNTRLYRRAQADKRNWMVFTNFFIPARATHVWRKHIAAIYLSRWSSIHVRSTFYLAHMRMVSYFDGLRSLLPGQLLSTPYIQMPLMPRRVCGYFHYRNDGLIFGRHSVCNAIHL